MEKMKVWFDEEGDFLEIGFGKKKGHFKDIGNDIWERVEEGRDRDNQRIKRGRG